MDEKTENIKKRMKRITLVIVIISILILSALMMLIINLFL
jgi:flagellar basal body-associated protein FliL